MFLRLLKIVKLVLKALNNKYIFIIYYRLVIKKGSLKSKLKKKTMLKLYRYLKIFIFKKKKSIAIPNLKKKKTENKVSQNTKKPKNVKKN